MVAFLSNWNFAVDEVHDAFAYKAEAEATLEETAIWFLENYESSWTKWVPSDVAANVKAALAE